MAREQYWISHLKLHTYVHVSPCSHTHTPHCIIHVYVCTNKERYKVSSLERCPLFRGNIHVQSVLTWDLADVFSLGVHYEGFYCMYLPTKFTIISAKLLIDTNFNSVHASVTSVDLKCCSVTCIYSSLISPSKIWQWVWNRERERERKREREHNYTVCHSRWRRKSYWCWLSWCACSVSHRAVAYTGGERMKKKVDSKVARESAFSDLTSLVECRPRTAQPILPCGTYLPSTLQRKTTFIYSVLCIDTNSVIIFLSQSSLHILSLPPSLSLSLFLSFSPSPSPSLPPATPPISLSPSLPPFPHTHCFCVSTAAAASSWCDSWDEPVVQNVSM